MIKAYEIEFDLVGRGVVERNLRALVVLEEGGGSERAIRELEERVVGMKVHRPRVVRIFGADLSGRELVILGR